MFTKDEPDLQEEKTPYVIWDIVVSKWLEKPREPAPGRDSKENQDRLQTKAD